MTTKLLVRKLKLLARMAAYNRGHELTRFVKVSSATGAEVFHAFCKKCVGHAQVTPEPAPNGIDISGSAVALNCKIKSAAELRDIADWARILEADYDPESHLVRKRMVVVPGKHKACGLQWHEHRRDGSCAKY